MKPSRIFAPIILEPATITPQIRRMRWADDQYGAMGRHGPADKMEPIAGRVGWCVMGIETLNIAAHAAGFAMAGSEEAFDDRGADPRAAETQWKPGRPVLVREGPESRTDWMSLLQGLFGRRARVSPV